MLEFAMRQVEKISGQNMNRKLKMIRSFFASSAALL